MRGQHTPTSSDAGVRVIPDDLLRGDLVKVVWVDIAEDPVGNPNTAVLSKRTSFGLFWARREDEGLAVLVTTTTQDDDTLPDQNGYCIYPESVIRELKVVKRVRRPRKPKEQQLNDGVGKP